MRKNKSLLVNKGLVMRDNKYHVVNQWTDPEALLNSQQASVLLGLSLQTLAHWRVKGMGPAFVKPRSGQRGRVFYPINGLKEFIASYWQAPHQEGSLT